MRAKVSGCHEFSSRKRYAIAIGRNIASDLTMSAVFFQVGAKIIYTEHFSNLT